MSWPLASFLVVGVVLALGWLAYERARPSARMVAVVGTLAAVAALGRDAFVALPDVKPITAMTLVVGYALGPLPGFSVGALGMLASNFVLGQGPYTPWQMAAWGLVGLAGAALGALSGRRLGRVQLALAVRARGARREGGDERLHVDDRRKPHAGRVPRGGRPGPAVRSHRHGRELPLRPRLRPRARAAAWRACARRMDVSWEPSASPRPAAGGAAAGQRCARRPRADACAGGAAARDRCCALALVGIARRATRRERGVARRAELSLPRVARRTPTAASARARGQHSSELYTALGRDGARRGRAQPGERAAAAGTRCSTRCAAKRRRSGLGDAERTILAARACGASAYSFAGRNLVAEVLQRARARRLVRRAGQPQRVCDLRAARRRALAASFARSAKRPAGSSASRTATAASASAGAARAATSTTPARRCRRWPPPARATGACSASPRLSGRARRAVDGGFPAAVRRRIERPVDGLGGAGPDRRRARPGTVRRGGSRTPLGYLESLLAPGGSVRYSRTSAQTPVWVTAQALIALAGKTFPVA